MTHLKKRSLVTHVQGGLKAASTCGLGKNVQQTASRYHQSCPRAKPHCNSKIRSKKFNPPLLLTYVSVFLVGAEICWAKYIQPPRARSVNRFLTGLRYRMHSSSRGETSTACATSINSDLSPTRYLPQQPPRSGCLGCPVPDAVHCTRRVLCSRCCINKSIFSTLFCSERIRTRSIAYSGVFC